MKTHRYVKTGILALSALLLAGAAQAQNFTVAAFATGTQGEPNSGQNTGDDIGVPYGAGTIVWDGNTYDTNDGSTGAAYITANFSGENNTDVLVSMGPGYNNWYYEGSSASCPTGTVDASLFHAVQFDMLYDTNSALTIDQFNTGDDWPTNYLTPAALAAGGSSYMANNGGYYTQGINVDLFTGSGGANYPLGTFQIPVAAAQGWVTVTMPYSDSLPNLSTCAGLWFQGAFGGGSGINGGPYNASFWIDNLVLVTNLTAALPPTLKIAPSAQGLNLFAGTSTALNNRESLETVANDYSWVGAAGPVSYSFTINSYPIGAGDQFQTHIFLDPNPSAGSAPDYADPNVIFMDLESNPNGVTWLFRYKTNEPNLNSMVYGSGTLAQINSSTGLGTWTVTFNDDTNVTMTTPSGSSTNFNIPDSTGDTSALFASGVAVFFGAQANNTGAASDHIVASDFSVTGLGAADFNDNFVADAGTLNTGLWEVNAAHPVCVQLLGAGDPYWVSWTLPASGFSLDVTSNLSATSTFQPVTTNPGFTAGTLDTQLISTNDLPAGQAAYFALVKRTFSQLLILLPGETNAPGTATGKVGTPAPFSQSASGGLLTFTVLAVDSKFYPVGGISDTLSFSDNNGGAFQAPYTLANGAGQFTVYYPGTGSGVVITATDTTTPSIPAANSTSFTVGP